MEKQKSISERVGCGCSITLFACYWVAVFKTPVSDRGEKVIKSFFLAPLGILLLNNGEIKHMSIGKIASLIYQNPINPLVFIKKHK